jgi:hypothetical protein
MNMNMGPVTYDLYDGNDARTIYHLHIGNFHYDVRRDEELSADKEWSVYLLHAWPNKNARTLVKDNAHIIVKLKAAMAAD